MKKNALSNICIRIIVAGSSTCLLRMQALAEPLQGYAEQSNALTRVQRPIINTPDSKPQDYADNNSAPLQASIINTQDFSPASQIPKLQSPTNNQQIPGTTAGGQDEYWVDWNSWERRVEKFGTRIGLGTWLYTDTYIYYSVTHDGHIQIVGAKSPDPTGKSIAILSNIVKQFEGNPVLRFPSGSKQNIHYTSFFLIGLPGIWPIATPTPRAAQTEYTVRQW